MGVTHEALVIGHREEAREIEIDLWETGRPDASGLGLRLSASAADPSDSDLLIGTMIASALDPELPIWDPVCALETTESLIRTSFIVTGANAPRAATRPSSRPPPPTPFGGGASSSTARATTRATTRKTPITRYRVIVRDNALFDKLPVGKQWTAAPLDRESLFQTAITLARRVEEWEVAGRYGVVTIAASARERIVDAARYPLLRWLDVRAAIDTLPREILALRDLRSLSLSLPKTNTFPSELQLLTELRALSIQALGISDVPTWLSDLRHLHTLDLGLSPMTSLHARSIDLLRPLTRLSLGNVPSLPEAFASLKTLRHLSIGLPTGVLPIPIARLPELTSIEVRTRAPYVLWPSEGLARIESVSITCGDRADKEALSARFPNASITLTKTRSRNDSSTSRARSLW